MIFEEIAALSRTLAPLWGVNPTDAEAKLLLDLCDGGLVDEFIEMLSATGPNSVEAVVHSLSTHYGYSKFHRIIWAGETSPALFPFARSIDGHLLVRVVGQLDSGEKIDQVVVTETARGPPEIERFEMGPAQFLDGLFSGRVRCTLFPDDFPSPAPSIVVPLSFSKITIER